MTAALDGWEHTEFTADHRTREVFRRGAGPGVVVIHEIPGITPKVARFANDLVASGFTVAMPSLVGSPGRGASGLYGTASLLKVCIAREFTVWALQCTSPIVTWLRALALDLHASAGGPGVGAVGMCFTGGFALGMMVDPVMIAPVLSQPSLPFALGRPARHADLNLSAEDAELVAAAPRTVARCSACGSIRTSWSARDSTRCAHCSAPRSSPSNSRRPRSVITRY